MEDGVGARLKALRKRRGLTQGQVAEYAGISQSTLSEIERGEIAPKTIDAIVNLTHYFGTTADYLLGLSDDPSPRRDAPLPEVTRSLLEILDELSEGRRAELLAHARVLYEAEQAVAPIELPSAAPAGPVVASDANLRAGPGLDYAVVGGAFTGEPLQVVEQTADGGWLHLASGAWIAAGMVAGLPAGLAVAAMPERAGPVVELEPTAPAVESQRAPENAFACIGGCATPPPGSTCTIKGNVNSQGELIYHMEGWRDYNRTDVKPEEGDRWFCTAQEAEAAGFRAPQNP